MTNAQRKFQQAVRELGCIVCRLFDSAQHAPCDIHHMLNGGRRIDEDHVLGLCYGHHRAGYNGVRIVSRHPYKRAFEARYGTEAELLDKTRALVETEKLVVG